MSETSMKPLFVSDVISLTRSTLVSPAANAEFLPASTHVTMLNDLEYIPVSTRLVQGEVFVLVNTKRLNERNTIRKINEELRRQGQSD